MSPVFVRASTARSRMSRSTWSATRRPVSSSVASSGIAGFGARSCSTLAENAVRDGTDQDTALGMLVVDLGWRIQETEPLQYRLHVVVTTRFLQFKDDVHIHIKPETATTCVLNFSARSRFGRADYGANLGHILKLKRAIQSQLAV